MNKENKENKSKGKIRVFLFELEGSDETLLESVRTIAGAVNRTFNGPTTRVLVKSLPTHADDNEQDILEDEFTNIDEVTPDDVDDSTVKTKRARKFPTPKVLDIDLTSGDLGLKAFCELKKPNDQRGKYMVIATWLKEYRNIDEVSIDHIYTGYRKMSWTPPKDMGQIFRDAKNAGYFGNGTKKGTWKINHIGLGRILNQEHQGNGI